MMGGSKRGVKVIGKFKTVIKKKLLNFINSLKKILTRFSAALILDFKLDLLVCRDIYIFF